MLKQHPAFSYQVEHVGREKQPVLIVDNFLADPELLNTFIGCHAP